ncbi:hypothetical protein LOZ53_005439 [Ophidiomyces ophidiicola]|uniref:Uncharacterized protein n=1 Tax=Ophidiomyces ophidiicola TaxID=1387563 RepID=A0ACB8UPZ7_9EURO|nr:hypothetical protein LOZ64_005937 [Ophidiomyces ophidiicola]KAI1912441.1 hypothetical protein LOZ61_003270 [Ophidiomyces ophidiicola]KAI1931075.1 hypothetical protein LOZ60_000510 [Ophidiomyces ophidiicola]KAI1935883.1 hypothetical protein LOZ62_005831 [Ophidiomyces ophidiicola]KAI1961693.1 hypothetical protein LOZ59_002343 [Ophidiomyces ophidiicola]
MPSFVTASSPTVKPASVCQVSKTSQGSNIGPPRDDEFHVMERFANHAVNCSQCARPYATIRQGEALCPRGARHVSTMAQYIYSFDGKAYSLMARKMGTVQEIAIPPSLAIVADLMRALQHGLNVKKAQAAVIVHNEENNASGMLIAPTPNKDSSRSVQVIQHNRGSKQREGAYVRGTLFDNDVVHKKPRENLQPGQVRPRHGSLR